MEKRITWDMWTKSGGVIHYEDLKDCHCKELISIIQSSNIHCCCDRCEFQGFSGKCFEKDQEDIRCNFKLTPNKSKENEDENSKMHR